MIRAGLNLQTQSPSGPRAVTSPEQTGLPTSSRVFDTSTFLFLLAAFIFLYIFLFVPPFTPIVYNGDGMFFLPAGQRMYEGETIYRDFFEFVTPGTALVYFFLFKLFGLRPWIPNLLSLLLGLALAGLGVVIARKIMRPSLALLPSAIFLVAARELLCEPTHHWFSLLATTAAIAVLMERRTPARIAAAGFFCGLTSCFTQTRGLAVAVGFGVYLWWESRRRQEAGRELLKKEGWLVTSFLATLIAVNGNFIWKAGPARFLWCTVVYVLKYYPKMADVATFRVFWINFPGFVPSLRFLHWFIGDWVFLHAVVPFIFILFFVRYGRKSGKEPGESWDRPMLVAIVGAFLLLSIAPSPAPNRIAASALPGTILLGWLLDSPRKIARALAAAIAMGVLLLALLAVVRKRPIPDGTLTTPQGKMAITIPSDYEEYTWVQQHTRPSEYFFEAVASDMYFRLDLRNPTTVPYITNCGFTTVGQVAEVIQGLEKHKVRYLLWEHGDLDAIPDWEDPSDDHLGPLLDYVHSHYQAVKVFTNADEIWERKGR
ncbi:MAG TPA: hypothetical protein VKO18_00605 [Terriglobia bacterium]|nr:hypothetical protein [Terriglobia bacterium]